MTEPPSLETHGVSAPLDPPLVAGLGGDGKLSRGALSWAIFEGGRDPYVILMTIYIFMPYVASVMVGDPVRGQEIISRWQQYAGWIVMATAPFLGAAIDRLGRRKGLLALIVGLMVPLIAALWWAKPDLTGLTVTATMAIAMVVNVLFSYSEVLHNSLLIRAAGLGGAHRASGLALALGNAASVAALAFTAWAFALAGKVPWAPATPLFGLSAASHEPQRVVALLSAGILLLGSIPIFLFTPDAPRTVMPVGRAIAAGAADLWAMLRTVRRYRDAAIYLVSRMVFVDAMNAVLFFSGIYAIGVMKWGALEMLAYGILLSVMAAIGGLAARALDAAVGPKNAVRIQIVMTILGLIALLGIGPDRIFFFWTYDPAQHAPLWNGPVFRHLPDLIYVLVGFSNAVFISGQYASSRTTLTRLTPPEQTGAFFGAYAVSGVATAWLAPTLVTLGTRLSHSQQGGFATIVALLLVSLVGLGFVKGGGRVPA